MLILLLKLMIHIPLDDNNIIENGFSRKQIWDFIL